MRDSTSAIGQGRGPGYTDLPEQPLARIARLTPPPAPIRSPRPPVARAQPLPCWRTPCFWGLLAAQIVMLVGLI